jgi:ABC-2 type transport system ATP-binding protein
LTAAPEGACPIVDVSLRVATGTIEGIVGEPYGGTSTLLRALAGVVPCRVARIDIAGVDAMRLPALARRMVGLLSVGPGLYDDLTVDETVRFFGAAQGLHTADDWQAAEELLDVFDLRERRHQRVGGLDTDERRRLGVLRCLLHDPQVVLLDEPFIGVTQQTRDSLELILRDLAELGKTIVLTGTAGHDDPIMSLCPRVHHMRAGRLDSSDDGAARLIAAGPPS